MDRLRDLEVFVAVADAGSLAGAGARLRLSPPAVTRAIAALERRLGGRLFNRTTRSLAITDMGRRFLAHARRLLADLELAEKEAVGEAATPQGALTITAPVTFGRLILTPTVGAFLDTQPLVTVSMLLLDRVANLIEEGIDLAVRIGALPSSALMARKVGSVRRILVASPGYLARHGAPARPAELRPHALVAFTGLMQNREWRFVDGKKSGGVAIAPRLEVNDAMAAIAAAEAGDGITITLSYMVADKIRAGQLVPVLEEFAPPPVPVHLVYPESRLIAPKLRAFVDFATLHLRDALEQREVPIGATAPIRAKPPRRKSSNGA